MVGAAILNVTVVDEYGVDATLCSAPPPTGEASSTSFLLVAAVLQRAFNRGALELFAVGGVPGGGKRAAQAPIAEAPLGD